LDLMMRGLITFAAMLIGALFAVHITASTLRQAMTTRPQVADDEGSAALPKMLPASAPAQKRQAQLPSGPTKF
jgi:hypothetical protein